MCIPGYTVTKDDLELLILLHLPDKYWEIRPLDHTGLTPSTRITGLGHYATCFYHFSTQLCKRYMVHKFKKLLSHTRTRFYTG